MTSATRLSRGHGVPTDHTHAVKNTVRNMVSNLESVINNLQGVVGDLRVLVHQIDAVSNRLDDQYSARWKMSPTARRPWPPSVARRNGSLARETVDPTSAKGWQKLRDSFDSPDYSPDIDWSYLGLTGFDGFLQQQQDKLEQKQQKQLRLQKEKLQEKLQEQEQRLREQREREKQLQDSKPVFSFKPQRVPAPSTPCSNRPSLLQSPDKLGSGASFVGKSYHHHHHHRKHARLASSQKHGGQAQTRHSPTLPRIESGGSESSSAGTTPTSMSTSASSSSVTSHVFCDDVTTGNEGADGKYCGFYEALMESELEKLSDCEAEGNFSEGEAAVGDEEEEEEEEVVVSSRTSLSDSPVLSANYNRHVNPWTSFGLVHIDSAQESDDVVSESASDILNDNYIDSSFACTNPGFDSNFDGEIRI